LPPASWATNILLASVFGGLHWVFAWRVARDAQAEAQGEHRHV
jgi:hypothetical protein